MKRIPASANGHGSRPIADYALLSDCQSAALVDRGGSVDWLCLPHFDARSVFARLLDPDAGHWSIRPLGEFSVSRAYLDATMVLRTRFRTSDGILQVTDALASGPSQHGHAVGQEAPHALLRLAECTSGTVDIEVEFVPRPEYGRVRPPLGQLPGAVLCECGPDALALSSPVRLAGIHQAHAAVRLRRGDRLAFALQYAPAGERPRLWSADEVEDALNTTVRSWRLWASVHQRYDGPWADQVNHSGRVLQALTFVPTGAIVAAPTTSLPETIGGVRNWDYRYSWVRDAAFTLHALWVAACPDEAKAFFTWMTDAGAGAVFDGQPLQTMFGIRGEHDLTERTLDHLNGWRGSRPVRVGNAAWTQRQLDVYGELLDAAYRLRDQLDGYSPSTRRFLVSLADAAAQHWQEADHSIWEYRGEPRHFVYSKLMCWVALDRACALTRALHATDREPGWRETLDRIRDAIETYGWNEKVGAYTQSFGSEVLDASLLMLPIVGFAPPDDPRVRATVAAVRERLTGPDGLVYRYRDSNDGLDGNEGTFLLCSFWLAHALALTGDVPGAREVFRLAVGRANDVGLLAEEADPVSGELLGNFPQAFSHIGLVNAACAIADAEGRSNGARKP